MPLQSLTSLRLVLPGDNLHRLWRKTKKKMLPQLYTSCRIEKLISKNCPASWCRAENNKQLNHFEEELGKRVTVGIIMETYVSKKWSRYISSTMASQSEYFNTRCSCKKIKWTGWLLEQPNYSAALTNKSLFDAAPDYPLL